MQNSLPLGHGGKTLQLVSWFVQRQLQQLRKSHWNAGFFLFACNECMPFFVTLAETNVADFLLKIDPSWMVGKLNHFPKWHFVAYFQGRTGIVSGKASVDMDLFCSRIVHQTYVFLGGGGYETFQG